MEGGGRCILNMSLSDKKKKKKVRFNLPEKSAIASIEQTFSLEQVGQLLRQQKKKLKQKVYTEFEVRNLLSLVHPITNELSPGQYKQTNYVNTPPTYVNIPKKNALGSQVGKKESAFRQCCKPCISLCGIAGAFCRIGCLPVKISYWMVGWMIQKIGMLFAGILIFAFIIAVIAYIVGNVDKIVTNANHVYSGVVGEKGDGVTWQPIPNVGTMESQNDRARRRRKERKLKEKQEQQNHRRGDIGIESILGMKMGLGTGIDLGKISKSERRRMENLQRHHERIREYAENKKKKKKKRHKKKSPKNQFI